MLSKQQIEQLTHGNVVAVLPTDTVYGLVCSAQSPTAIERLYALKNREDKPGTVVAASIDQLVDLGIPRRYLKAVEQFWPNPISVVIPVGDELGTIHLGKRSIACRIPSNPTFKDLLEQTGPLLTTSANHPGEEPANTIAQAKDYFHDDVDFYVDGGDLSNQKSSTVIRMIDDAVEVLREGAVKVTEDGQIQ